MVPPYDFNRLAEFLEVDPYHYRCCRTKAKDTVAKGWNLTAVKTPPKEDKEAQKLHTENYNKLFNFFQNCNPEMSFTEMLENQIMDYESIGNNFLEVVTDEKNIPIGLFHAPAIEMRVKKDKTGFLQITGNTRVHFKNFGDTTVVDKRTGKPASKNLKPEYQASCMIQFKKYSARYRYYGLPDIIPALGAIVGNLESRDYNIQFFENNAIPRYAIIVKGGSLDSKVERKIKKYFLEELKGRFHKTLVLSLPAGCEVIFQELDIEVKEGSFRMFRVDNRDQIIHVHQVPPARVGIIETANLGSGSGYSQAEMYKDAVIEPEQSQVESRYNKLIVRGGFGIDDWEFRLEDIDIRDFMEMSTIVKNLSESNSFSPNEIRKVVGYPPRIGGDRIWHGGAQLFLDEFGETKEELEKRFEYLGTRIESLYNLLRKQK
jgi:PBSX family phage portal protein